MNEPALPKSRMMANLICELPQGDPLVCPLVPEASIFVGSDPHCGLVIDSPRIAPRHAMLRLSGDQIFVTDWFSESGTYVNDQRISTETAVGPKDHLRLGDIVVRTLFHAAGDAPRAAAPAAAPPRAVPLAATEHRPAAADSAENDLLRQQLAQAVEEVAYLRGELDRQAAVQATADLLGPDDVQALKKEVEWLRQEVDQLQGELIERDQALGDGWASSAAEDVQAQAFEATDTAALVERLEQLLAELETNDRRTLALEDLLRSSDDAARAELEERTHLERWIGEIEQRMTEREQDWQAERTRLESRLANRNAARRVLEAPAADGAGSTDAALRRSLEVLQQQFEDVNDQLAEARQALQQTQRSSAEGGPAPDAAPRIEELEAQLRQQELETVQLRATAARQRAELDRLRANVEPEPRAGRAADSTDVRIREFREHLKGIHEQEKAAAQQQSLAARIARLWQRTERGR